LTLRKTLQAKTITPAAAMISEATRTGTTLGLPSRNRVNDPIITGSEMLCSQKWTVASRLRPASGYTL